MPLMPLLLSDAIILMAPVIKGHPRYAFPCDLCSADGLCRLFIFCTKTKKNFSMREEKWKKENYLTFFKENDKVVLLMQ